MGIGAISSRCLAARQPFGRSRRKHSKVDSLAEPGANVTGMSMMVPEVAIKRLQLLK
jgi:hypothetical protein